MGGVCAKEKVQLKPASVVKIRLVRTKVQLVSREYPYITINERISCTFDFKNGMSLVYWLFNCIFVFKEQICGWEPPKSQARGRDSVLKRVQ